MGMNKTVDRLLLPLCFLVVASFGAEQLQADEKPRPSLINQCMECHGNEGRAAIEGWPPIAGQKKEILVRKLKAYRNQLVKESVMSRGVHDLSDEQLEQVASYFSSLPAPQSKSGK